MSDALSRFTASYIETALWSETDDTGQPLEDTFAPSDLDPEALARMQADCAAFYGEHWAIILEGPCRGRYEGPEQAGHDFWLTRNSHGAGFWDGDWPEPAASILDEAAKKTGECSLYVGDDGDLYLFAG